MCDLNHDGQSRESAWSLASERDGGFSVGRLRAVFRWRVRWSMVVHGREEARIWDCLEEMGCLGCSLGSFVELFALPRLDNHGCLAGRETHCPVKGGMCGGDVARGYTRGWTCDGGRTWEEQNAGGTKDCLAVPTWT